MKQTFMENGRTSVENRGGMKEEGTVGGPAGTGKKRSHRLPEAAEVDRNLPIQVAAVCDTTGKLHPLWFRYAGRGQAGSPGGDRRRPDGEDHPLRGTADRAVYLLFCDRRPEKDL